MAKHEGLKQFLAGLFFILGIIVVGWVIYFIGFQRGMTEPKTSVIGLFDKVSGLIEGAPVRVSGVTVGDVNKISFLSEPFKGRGIQVKMDIYTKFLNQVKSCTKVSIFTEGVLGAKYVEISREENKARLDLENPILAEPLLDVYDLAEVLEDTADSFQDTTKGINIMMKELQYISGKTKRLMDRIERRVIDGNLFKVF